MTIRSDMMSLDGEGQALVARLGGRWHGNGGLCRCPAHEDRTPSLSIRPGRRRLLFHCFAGCGVADILAALAGRGLLAPGAPAAGRAPAAPSGRTGLAGAARRLWSAGRPIAGTPAATYLAARALPANSPELRFHPRTPWGASPGTVFRPALLAAVRDDHEVVAIHRTFLRGRCGAITRRAAAKCGLGRYGRGAVRLGGIGPRLGLAEGIETALAATRLFGLPCWATLGTERFATVGLPDQASELILFLDNDAGGRRAEALARGAFGGTCTIEARYPPRPGTDWNDVLLAEVRARGRR